MFLGLGWDPGRVGPGPGVPGSGGRGTRAGAWAGWDPGRVETYMFNIDIDMRK